MQQKFKIACIGCSYTQGIKLYEHKSYPNILYDILKKEMPTVEVYNCGIGGSSSKIHKVMFEWVEQTIKPDLIVYQITNDCRTQIIHDSDITTAFELDKKSDNYYTVNISKDKWACLPLYAYLGTVLPKSIGFKNKNEDDQAIKDFYKKYIESKSIMTYEQFLSMCLYKYHHEPASPVNWLDYVADNDYVFKYCKTKMIPLFWEKETMVDYNKYMQHNNRPTVDIMCAEDIFTNQNKNIDDFALDKQRHLNTQGNEIVAQWIKGKI